MRCQQCTCARRAALLATASLFLFTVAVVAMFPDWLADVRHPFRGHLTDVERTLLWQTAGAVTAALERANITYLMYVKSSKVNGV